MQATSAEPAPNATPFIRPSAIPRFFGSIACTIATPGAFCTASNALAIKSDGIASHAGNIKNPNRNGTALQSAAIEMRTAPNLSER